VRAAAAAAPSLSLSLAAHAAAPPRPYSERNRVGHGRVVIRGQARQDCSDGAVSPAYSESTNQDASPVSRHTLTRWTRREQPSRYGSSLIRTDLSAFLFASMPITLRVSLLTVLG